MSNKLKPTDKSAGYDVRPGDFLTMGATKVECGVNFTGMSIHAIGCEVVLYKRGAKKPYARIPFPPNYRIGNTYSMLVFGLNIDEFEYTYRIREIDPETKRPIYTPELLDIYAKAVVGQRKWGEKETGSEKLVKARVVENTFDWGNFVEPSHKFSDLIIYEMHVRGFTMDPSSKVKYPGSFKGIIEKIPYLKKLGINAIELMPIFEFDEMEGENAYAATYYAGDCLTMMSNNENLDFYYPKEGNNLFVDSMCIPKTAKNVGAAELFINFMLEEEYAIENSLYICYASPNKTVFESDEYKEELGEKEYSILYDVPKQYKAPDGSFDTSVAQYYYDLSAETKALLAQLWDKVK